MNTGNNEYSAFRYISLVVLILFGMVTIVASNGGGGGDGGGEHTYNISGTIEGPLMEYYALSLTGDASETTVIDTSGRFRFTELANGSYTITPTHGNYTFTPASQNVTVNDSDTSGIKFTATGIIAGIVSGDVSEGVTIHLSGPATDSVVTDANGIFSFSDLPTGVYTLAASASGYTFSPVSTVVYFTGIASPTNNFLAATDASTFSVSGRVSGDITANVLLILTYTGSSNIVGKTVSDINGDYSFTGIAGDDDYTLIPSRTDYIMEPPGIDIGYLAADSTNNNFISTSTMPDADRYSVSGNVSYTGLKNGDTYIVLQHDY